MGAQLNAAPPEIRQVEARKGFRDSIFAGTLAAHTGDLMLARAFAREIDRKSYQQVESSDELRGEVEPPYTGDSQKTYSVSRGELLVGGWWRCVRKIAFGSTGVVYLAYSLDYTRVSRSE